MTEPAFKVDPIDDEILAEEEVVEAKDVEQEPGIDPLWRERKALAWIKPSPIAAKRIGAALYWTRKPGAEDVFFKWLGELEGFNQEEARVFWRNLIGETRTGIGVLYDIALWLGWRWPIIFSGNHLDKVVEEAERVLVAAQAEIYQRDTWLVRPVVVEVKTSDGRTAQTAQLQRINEHYLMMHLARHIDWCKVTKDKEVVSCGPDRKVALGLLNRAGSWGFRRVNGVRLAQTMRPDGSLVLIEGYDRETGLILMNLPVMPLIPGEPSREEGLAAIKRVDALLDEFPFVDEPSHSVALTKPVTAVVRGALDCVPMNAVDAPVSGTGKSFLNDVTSAVSSGDIMPSFAASRSETEMEKRLHSELLDGASEIAIDNVDEEMELRGDALCHAIERPTVGVRVLGKSEKQRLRNTWTIHATGNNLTVAGDATRRTIVCSMDARVEQPIKRQFKRNPLKEVLANRGYYIADVLVAVRAYVLAGCPVEVNSIGDPFAAWNRLVRGMLIWYGYADPVLTMEKARDQDPERLKREQLFYAIKETWGAADPGLEEAPGFAKTAGEMVAAVSGSEGMVGVLPAGIKRLMEALVEVASKDGKINAHLLGTRALKKGRDQIAAGLKLRGLTDTHDKQLRWWVERVPKDA